MSLGETLSRCDTRAFVTALAVVADAMRRERAEKAKRATTPEIQARVCARFDVTREELLSRTRERRVSRPRQVAIYLAYRPFKRSLQTLARTYGFADHTSALHAVRQVAHLRSTDPAFDADVSALERELGHG